jgi:hypothetical protein
MYSTGVLLECGYLYNKGVVDHVNYGDFMCDIGLSGFCLAIYLLVMSWVGMSNINDLAEVNGKKKFFND